jgi:photosystem II stability/assembly factor-like uncharacterized protein
MKNENIATQKTMKKFFAVFFLLFALIMKLEAQWVEQSSGFTVPKRGVNSLCIVDPNVVWAVAYDGTNSSNYITEFSKTVNGGLNWSPGLLSTGIIGGGIANISAINADTAWACIFHPTQAVAGGIWKTTDGGSSWSKQISAAFVASSFPDFVHFWDANHGIAVGDPIAGYFEIYTTSDGGNNWIRTPNIGNQLSSVSVSEYGYTDGFSVRGNTLWFCTSDGRIFKTADKGFTFTSSFVGNGISDAQRVTFADTLLGYAAMHTSNNLSFRLAKTTDGGITWTNCSNNYTVTSTALLGGDVCAVPGTNYIVSVGSDLRAKGSSWSSDGGNSWWIMEDTSLAPQRTCVRFLDANTGWSGSFNTSQFVGGVAKTSGPVGIVKNSSENVFLIQPNPAGGNASIFLSGKIKGTISVRLISLSSEILFQQEFTSTETLSKVPLDLSDLSSGIYFVIVSDGINQSTQKLIHY